MIDIDNWMRELEEEEDIEIKNNEEYQTKLFEEYVLRGSDHQEERRKLNERYLSGEELMGEHGLRKELAAFDMSYFGRAYLPHYFIRKSPHFHEELDEIWSRGVMKGRNPLKEAKVISRLKGSRQVVAAPRGHAKSTNFTFKDSLHAILYAYKHYILILSDSSEQAEGFLDDIKTELEDNANIIMDFGSLKGDKAWRTGVILTKTDIKAEAIGSGKKVRGRRHRNWRPDLIVLDDIENDENVNTPEQRRKLKNWFDKAVSKAGDTYTDIMYIGTILHYDSLLNNVLQNPRYKTKKYRAVISEAVNPDVDTGTKRPVTARVAVGDVNDKFSDYPSNGLTPRRLARIFREADEGNVRAQMELFEEMEEKDTHLFSQMQTRKLAVTGLDWEVQPFSEDEIDKEIADFIDEQLKGIENFDEVLIDMLDAIGRDTVPLR